MLKKFKIKIPGKYKKLKYGFSLYEKSYVIIEKAISINEIKNKYPDATSIIQI